MLLARYVLPTASRCVFRGRQRMGAPIVCPAPVAALFSNQPTAAHEAAPCTWFCTSITHLPLGCTSLQVPICSLMLGMVLRALAEAPAPLQSLPSLMLVSRSASSLLTLLPTAASPRMQLARSVSSSCPRCGSVDGWPEPPVEPDPNECCGRGCTECVWTVYVEELQQYNADLAALEGQAPPEDPFAALERQLAEKERRAQQDQQGSQTAEAAAARTSLQLNRASAPAQPAYRTACFPGGLQYEQSDLLGVRLALHLHTAAGPLHAKAER